VIELPTGSGQWSVELEKTSSINRLTVELPAFITDLNAAGMTRLTHHFLDPSLDLYRRATELGVRDASRHSADGADLAVLSPPGDGGVIPDDPDVIVDWVDRVLADRRYKDTTQKLLDLQADERHVYLVTGALARLAWTTD
jgi:hypothetical protein